MKLFQRSIPTFKIFLGPPELKLYSVVDLKFCVQLNSDSNITEILVEFFLSKPLMGNFLTQFLPTALFLIIRKTQISLSISAIISPCSQTVIIFSDQFIDMVIEVNLTILLVLTTLWGLWYQWYLPFCQPMFSFTGINDSLPQTDYVKLIDVWMLFSMIFAFLGVILYSSSQVQTLFLLIYFR